MRMTEERSDRVSLLQFMTMLAVFFYLLGFATGVMAR